MEFKLVYETSSYEPNYMYIVFLAILFTLLAINKRRFINRYQIIYYILLLLIISIFYGIYEKYSKSKAIKELFYTKNYLEVTGKINSFHAMPKGGHDIEKFNVNGIHFEIPYTGNFPNAKTQFYTLTKNRNGPIQKNGQQVKIYYIKDDLPNICIPFTKKCITFNKNQENKIIKMWIKVDGAERRGVKKGS